MNRRVYYRRGYNSLYVFVISNGLQTNDIYSFPDSGPGKLLAEIMYLDFLLAGH